MGGTRFESKRKRGAGDAFSPENRPSAPATFL